MDKERNKGEGRERETEKKEKIETAREGWARTKEKLRRARAKYSLVARESPSHAHTLGARDTRANSRLSSCTDIMVALCAEQRRARAARQTSCCTRIHT